MNQEMLRREAEAFARRWQGSEETQKHIAEHERRIARAQELLRPERIAHWTEDDLRALLLDTDAFAFWSDKEREFQKRLARIGLDGFQQAFQTLITEAEKGLTPEALETVLQTPGLGPLLVTELLCYRFPERYWVYHDPVLQVLRDLGEDVKARVPRGKKSSNAHLYFAAREPLEQIHQALREAGVGQADFSTVDIFLWELRQARRGASLTPKTLSDLLRKPSLTPQEQERADRFLQEIATHLQERLGAIKVHIGPQNPQQGKERYDLAYLLVPLVPGLISGKNTPTERRDLRLEVHLLRGRIWWGVYVWGSRAQIHQLAEAFRALGLLQEHETLQVAPGALGYPREVWAGGAYFALSHERSADEVAQIGDLSELTGRIAEDLVAYYERFAPAGPDLRRAMEVDASADDFNVARQVLERLYPDEATRRQALGAFRQAILSAHQANPAAWGVSLHPDRVRLVVGDVVVASMHKDLVWLVVDHTALPEALQAEVRPLVDEGFRYRSYPEGMALYLPANQAVVWYERLAEPYGHFIGRVLARMPHLRGGVGRRYTNEVLAYMEAFMGEPLPRPTLEVTVSSLSGHQLADLLQGAFQAQGLHFTPEQIATFYTALQTKGFVILSGISGTGKTKLAQHFAALLPQPYIPTDEDTGDRLAVTVQPYMLKYNRLIVPKRATQFFTPPAPGESVEVEVTFGADQETCRFTHAAYGDSDYLSLLLRGRARRWFAEHFREGDLLYLEPQSDEDGALHGFRLLTAGEAAAAQSGKTGRNWLFLSVRPDWRDGKALLGYYNPLTGTYHWTPFLRFVLQAARSYRVGDDLAWFIILDEMNLARVEYYFGDLLSVLESGRNDEGWTREPLRCTYPEDAEGDLPPREVYLPPNLYIVGTVNVDETTHALSPKVLDRAFTLELTEADFEVYLKATGDGTSDIPEETRRALLAGFTRQGRFVRQDKAALRGFVAQHLWISRWLTALNQALRPYELHFGYRVFDEIVAFLQAAAENGLFDPLGGPERAFDLAVLMKVLPKFHGSRGRLEAPLKQVLAWCVNPEEPAANEVEQALQEALSQHDDPQQALQAAVASLDMRLPRTAGKVLRMLWHLYTTGFAAF